MLRGLPRAKSEMGLSNQRQANRMCSENSKVTQEALEKTATLTLLDFFSSVEIVFYDETTTTTTILNIRRNVDSEKNPIFFRVYISPNI